MAVDSEEDASDSRLCQQAGGTDLGDAVGKPYFSGKDNLEYDSCLLYTSVLDYGFQNFTKTDASYGCETISGGTAMLPQNVKLESLTTKAEETEEGTLVTYELSNQVVGSAVMTDENYAVFQEKRGVQMCIRDRNCCVLLDPYCR